MLPVVEGIDGGAERSGAREMAKSSLRHFSLFCSTCLAPVGIVVRLSALPFATEKVNRNTSRELSHGQQQRQPERSQSSGSPLDADSS